MVIRSVGLGAKAPHDASERSTSEIYEPTAKSGNFSVCDKLKWWITWGIDTKFYWSVHKIRGIVMSNSETQPWGAWPNPVTSGKLHINLQTLQHLAESASVMQGPLVAMETSLKFCYPILDALVWTTQGCHGGQIIQGTGHGDIHNSIHMNDNNWWETIQIGRQLLTMCYPIDREASWLSGK